jgi:hypothetical protein
MEEFAERNSAVDANMDGTSPTQHESIAMTGFDVQPAAARAARLP